MPGVGRRRLAGLVGLPAALLLAGGVAVATTGSSEPGHLRAIGPVSVTGTEGTGVFEIGDRTIRQVRYADRSALAYSFVLHNGTGDDTHLHSDAADQTGTRLFHFAGLTADGANAFVVPAGESRSVTLTLTMSGCETLAARSGSFYETVVLRTEDGTVELDLPEELHTGSPREAACPDSTATSRPQG